MTSITQNIQESSSTPVLSEVSRFVILREEYVNLVTRLAEGINNKVQFCAAKLLDYLDNWKNWKLKEHRTEWIYLPLKRIHKDLLGEHSIHVIRAAIAFLVKVGLLDRRKNPGNGQDRTHQYRLLLEGSPKKHKSKPSAETPTASPFVRSESPEFRSESWRFNADKYHRSISIDSRSINTHESEERKEASQEEVASVISDVVLDTTLLESDEDLWEEKPSQSIPDENQSSAAPRDVKKVKVSQASVIKDLLDNRVFQLWWANRVKQTKFGTQELIMTPEAFVKASIRKHPEQALDMFASFQDEMSHRVDNFQLRATNDCQISAEEQEQIKAIAPYATATISAPVLPAAKLEAPDSAENPEAYKLYQPKQVEAAPPPPGLLEKLKQATARMTMPKSKTVEPSSELDELNRWIADPLLRPEALKRVMGSDLYTADFDEEGVPYHVRRV